MRQHAAALGKSLCSAPLYGFSSPLRSSASPPSRAAAAAAAVAAAVVSARSSPFSAALPRRCLSVLSSPAAHTALAATPPLPLAPRASRHLVQQRRPPPQLTSVRYCSARRNMCRHAEAESGSLTAPTDRQILPTNVKPIHYDLTLEPDFTKFTYEGLVKIELDVVDDSTSISLNTLELTVHSAKVLEGDKVITDSPKITFDEDSQTTKAEWDELVKAGAKLTYIVKFTGKLNDSMAGFYRSSYKDKDSGETRYLATTQMEPTDARRAFPCFDEPALKSKFDVTLIAEKRYTCLSNMDVKEEKDVQSEMSGSTKKAVSFNTTPLISTYLLAFIVGELNYIETKAFRVPVRVYATIDQDISHGQFSLDLAARTLEFYEKTFQSDFPLPKMDMVAIPDFAAGAMENWGLITYRVVDLLFDEAASGAATKQRVAEVVQHELAHQWFGNLVTMDFWDGLWLNEGFATWMSWYSCNVFYPEWKVWQSYVTDNLQSALSLDSLRSSHPVEVPVKRADEINQIFDAISYSKGSCVLRMISKYLGEDVFMEGVRRYLKKHAFGNTTTGDLWAALSDASGKDVSKVMDIWTKKVGYPVVTVTEKDNKIHLEQHRFLRAADLKPEEDQTLYPVFLGLRSKDGINEDLTLTAREADFEVDLDFYKLNADHSGLYRTSYTTERLAKLGDAARKGLLSVEDRAGMIADAGALASSGYQKTSGLLNLLKGFQSETEFVVWDELLNRIGTVRGAWMFEGDETKDGLKTFMRDLVAEKAHTAGWKFKPGEDHVQAQFKSMLFGTAGGTGDKKVIEAAKEMFKKFAAGDKSAIDPNLRGSVFSINLKEGGQEEYDVLLETYRKSTNSDERNTALRALGQSRIPKNIETTLGLALSSEVKEQDIFLPLAGLRAHPEGVQACWEWLKENWDAIAKKLPAGLSMLGSVVQICTSSFTSQKAIDEITQFFGSRSTKGFDQSLAQSLEAIKAKSLWLERDRADVQKWLEENGYSGESLKGKL